MSKFKMTNSTNKRIANLIAIFALLFILNLCILINCEECLNFSTTSHNVVTPYTAVGQVSIEDLNDWETSFNHKYNMHTASDALSDNPVSHIINNWYHS